MKRFFCNCFSSPEISSSENNKTAIKPFHQNINEESSSEDETSEVTQVSVNSEEMYPIIKDRKKLLTKSLLGEIVEKEDENAEENDSNSNNNNNNSRSSNEDILTISSRNMNRLVLKKSSSCAGDTQRLRFSENRRLMTQKAIPAFQSQPTFTFDEGSLDDEVKTTTNTTNTTTTTTDAKTNTTDNVKSKEEKEKKNEIKIENEQQEIELEIEILLEEERQEKEKKIKEKMETENNKNVDDYYRRQSRVSSTFDIRSLDLKICIEEFNKSAKKGVILCNEKGIFDSSNPDEIAQFLYDTKGLSRKQIGEYLGQNQKTLVSYSQLFDFAGLEIDDALRVFLSGFQLLGEAQIIDRIMDCFAQQFASCNPEGNLNETTAAVMAFAIIMLNTDLHSGKLKQQMTPAAFIKNFRGVDSGKDFPKAFLLGIYERVKANKLKFNEQEMKLTAFCSPQKQGWLIKEGGRIKTKRKRWFILKDGCLYYFESPEHNEPKGIVALERNTQVRSIGRSSFEIFNQDHSSLKSNKRVKHGKVVQGQHANFMLHGENEKDTQLWIEKINGAILALTLASRHDKQSVSEYNPENENILEE